MAIELDVWYQDWSVVILQLALLQCLKNKIGKLTKRPFLAYPG